MKRRARSRIANWKIGEYIRQLSIVTLGVVITFVGSDVISEYNMQSRLKTAILLVKGELELKHDDVLAMKARYDKEVAAAQYLQKYKDRLEQANEDTLAICISTPFQSIRFNPAEDAMEVLKSSGLFQQIKNQELTLALIKTNDVVRMQAYGTFNSYSDRKKEIIDKISNHPTYSAEYEKMENSSTIDKARFSWQNQDFRELSSLPLFFINSDNFVRVADTINKMIEQIDREYDIGN